jgi:hypothetical protein
MISTISQEVEHFMNQKAKETLRSAVAIAAGYVVMALLVMLVSMLLWIVFPKACPSDGMLPSLPWVVFLLIFNTAAATAGGYVTSMICHGSRSKHIQGLMVVIVLLGLIYLAANVNKQPLWYLIAQIVVELIGVSIGGSVPVKGKH